MSEAKAYLIERKYDSVTHYFSSHTSAPYPDSSAAFRTEGETAVRFARREDAEYFLRTYLSRNGSVHEHIWLDQPQ